MKRHLSKIIVSLLGTAAVLACCGRQEPQEKIEFKSGQFTSAERCGACHKEIYAAWRNSLHAGAAEEPIFKASYQEAIQHVGNQAKTLCLTCHAPSVTVTQDYDLVQAATREGVHCDFCHSLKGTELSNPKNPFLLEVSQIKFGPIPDAASTGHQVAFSEFHTSSLMCAGCHEYRNPYGVPLLSTYSEWEFYRQHGGDKLCQGCHMPQVLAPIVDPKVKRVKGGFINFHLMPGGHSRDQLVKSLRMRITRINRTNKGLAVQVELKNIGAGHMVPTGIPTRKVILTVEATTERGESFRAERVYQRVLLDDQNRELMEDSLIFSEARKVARDTRIAAGEQRIEDFMLPSPSDVNVTLKATVTYLYSPQNRKESETRIDFYSEQKELLSSWAR